MQRLLTLSLSLVLALPLFSQNYKKEIKQLDQYAQQALEDWNVPGMAVAVVQGDEIIFEKGYGVKSVNTGEAVDPHSLFAVASNTKSVTAAALAILVDEGKIDWDDKVQTYLPWFQLYDPYVSANITIRDLLCHRSGLDTFSGDLLWYGSSHSREEVLRRAKHLEPVYGFREHYGYQNIMFLAAGQIIPVVTGQEWEDFVQERILTPIGMKNTLYSTSQINAQTNMAMPHNTVDGKNVEIDFVNWDNIAPAGALLSSVHEWSTWMRTQMNYGKYGDQQIWSEARAYEMWDTQTPETMSAGARNLWPTRKFTGYALGWEVESMHGEKIVSHGGGYDGMISRTVMVPGKDIGIVVLTNSISSLSYAITYKWMDLFLDADETQDWSELFLNFKKRQEAAEEEARKEREANRNTEAKHTLELSEYAGTYRDKMYGDLIIRVIGDQLAFQFEPTSLFRGTLRHWHYDTFELNWGTQMMLPSGTVQFKLDKDGDIEGLAVECPNPDFLFEELDFKRVDEE